MRRRGHEAINDTLVVLFITVQRERERETERQRETERERERERERQTDRQTYDLFKYITVKYSIILLFASYQIIQLGLLIRN